MHALAVLLYADMYMPHGYCYMWNRPLVWTHVISDSIVALSYTAIPATLIYFVRKRRGLPFHWMFLLFGLFIISCGATHYMEVWNLWHADYWLAGIIKAITAAASVGTAALLIPLVPRALALPQPDDLRAANLALVKQSAELEEANHSLRQVLLKEKIGEEQLRRSEERFRALLESASQAVIAVDGEGRIVLANAKTEQTFGYSREELLGMTLENLLPERYRGGHAAHRKEYREHPRPRAMGGGLELSGLRKDGSEFPAEVSLSYVQTAEDFISMSLVTDITARKQAEANVAKLNHVLEQRATALEEANKELEAFTYSVSHDLRAPLRHVDGFSRLLLEEHGGQLSPEGKRMLERVRHGTQRMGELVDDLLNLSRVSRREVNLLVTDLNSILEEVLTELKPAWHDRQVEFCAGRLPFAPCDPGLIRQVFANLLSNALKFTRPRERAVIEVGQSKQNGHNAVFVRDNGVGFSMKYADKLFGVFQRLHRAEDFEGTGVGLATVQRIIQKHGGRIWVQAEIDKGATFYFTLEGIEDAHPVKTDGAKEEKSTKV